MAIDWGKYRSEEFYDELIVNPGKPRHAANELCRFLGALSDQELAYYQKAAEIAIRTMGITFTVYSEADGSIDRAWPFDVIPRVIEHSEWKLIERGLKQRVQALNLFIHDLYHRQKILKDKVVPRELIANSRDFREQCRGITPPHKVWAHICGSDLVRDKDGTVYVLEDNLRVPSGVSYMLENRQIMKRVFPDLFENYSILPIDDYPSQLFECLSALSRRRVKRPEVVVLTPGIYNSAYFEHAYLAQQMGAELVEGSDLLVAEDDCVYMRTIEGLSRVDVIYRRIDDLFLDPEVFHKDSKLGVPGLIRAWRKGNVALANAPGSGVADDKVIYTYVPKIIRYYLDQEPILSNVPSYLCVNKNDREHVLANLDQLVVKPANESGGYGMLMGPVATRKEREAFAEKINRNPRNYMAQPMLNLSTAPALIGNHAEPRHLDLRPFILSGKKTYVTTGGLTRVAMRKGSNVVNSSQGGGSKDTWVVDTEGY